MGKDGVRHAATHHPHPARAGLPALVGAGKTSWETARILGIAARTVDFHLANACAKLGVANRRAAVARAVQCGLLPALTAAAPPHR